MPRTIRPTSSPRGTEALQLTLLPNENGTFTSPPPNDRDKGGGARLGLTFLRELRVIFALATGGCSLGALTCELLLVGALTFTVLCTLRVEASPNISVWILILVCTTTLVGAVLANSCAYRGRGWPGAFGRHSSTVLFVSAQAGNIAGFYATLVPSLFYGALIQGKSGCGMLQHALTKASIFLSAAVLTGALTSFTMQSIALTWRDALTRMLQQRYSALALYALQIGHPSVDNPDQRVTQEVTQWSTTLAMLMLSLSQSLFSFVWYSYVTWTITGWNGPIFIYFFFALTAFVTQFVASPIAGLVATVDAAEGDFRRAHVEALQGAEAAALAGGGMVHDAALDGEWATLLRWQWKLLLRQAVLTSVIFLNEYTGAVVCYIVLGVAICTGMYDGHTTHELAVVVSQGAGFGIKLIFGCTQIVRCLRPAMQLSGYTRRLFLLLRALDAVETDLVERAAVEFADGKRALVDASAHIGSDGEAGSGCGEEPLVLDVKGLTVEVPAAAGRGEARVLLRELSFCVRRGGALLLKGASGVGKSSLLRVIAGLWPVAAGTVRCVSRLEAGGNARDARGCCVFVPQAPHVLRVGSLRQQLTHPLETDGFTDDSLLGALRVVGLEHLVLRLGGLDKLYCTWSALLSPGQLQLLCLARILVHRPALAILDEATAAVDVDAEARVYGALRAERIALLSVGHRTSLVPFHDSTLSVASPHDE